MMKPVCVPCERFMRPLKNDFYFIEGMPVSASPERGKGAAGWKPYKLWAGDLWKCSNCGATIIAGTGTAPLAEHFQSHFSKTVERTGARLVVKDC